MEVVLVAVIWGKYACYRLAFSTEMLNNSFRFCDLQFGLPLLGLFVSCLMKSLNIRPILC